MKRYIIRFELEDTFLAENEEDAEIQMIEQINSMSCSQLLSCMEAYKVIKNDLDRLEKLEKKVERIKECIGMATSVTITDSLNSTRNDILAEVREVLKNA